MSTSLSAKTLPRAVSWASGSSASKATVCTAAPWPRGCPGGGAGGPERACCSSRGPAPDSGRRSTSSDGETAGQVGREHTARVEFRSQCPEVVEARVHRGEEFGAQAGVLGEVDATAGRGDLLVELVEEGAEAGQTRGEVQGERPAGHGEREPPRGGL